MNPQRAILHTLSNQIKLIEEPILHTEVNFRAELTRSELRATLEELEVKSQVVGMRGEDQIMRWKITDEGRARLKQGSA